MTFPGTKPSDLLILAAATLFASTSFFSLHERYNDLTSSLVHFVGERLLTLDVNLATDAASSKGSFLPRRSLCSAFEHGLQTV